MAEIEKENQTLNDKFVGALLILGKSDEWKIYKELLKNQIKVRENQLMKMYINNEDMAKHNLIYGEILGLKTAMELPDIAVAKVENEKIMEDFRKEKENGRRD